MAHKNKENMPLIPTSGRNFKVLKVLLYIVIFLMVTAALIIISSLITIYVTRASSTIQYAVYERIGSNQCPDGRKLIYSGVTIGYNSPPLNYTRKTNNSVDMPTTTTGFRCMPSNNFQYYDDDDNFEKKKKFSLEMSLNTKRSSQLIVTMLLVPCV